MIRTQIYLTERQKGMLSTLSVRLGQKQSELIREALDRFIEAESRSRKEKILRETAGIWDGREDLPGWRR
jgi:hypothetical protein